MKTTKPTFEYKPFIMSARDYHEFEEFATNLHDNHFGKWSFKELEFIDGAYRAVFWREDTKSMYEHEIKSLLNSFNHYE